MVYISQENLQEIMKVVGYPVITFDELEIKEEDVKQLIIWTAMKKFFKFFPILNKQEYQLTSTYSIPFPNPNTFLVVDGRLNTAGFIARDSDNPFVNNSIYRSVQTSTIWGGGMYGTTYDYGMREARQSERSERQATIEQNKAFRFDVDYSNRIVTGFSNVTGKVVITWGEYSEDFNKIPFGRLDEVIALSQAELLRYLGNLRAQQVTGLPSSFNYQSFITRADDLEKEVVTKWQKFAKNVIIRG